MATPSRCWPNGVAVAVAVAGGGGGEGWRGDGDEDDEDDADADADGDGGGGGGEAADDGGDRYRGSCGTPSGGDGTTSCDWKNSSRETSRRTPRNRKNRSSSLNLSIYVSGYFSGSTTPAGSLCRGACPPCPGRRGRGSFCCCPDDGGGSSSPSHRCESCGGRAGDLSRASFCLFLCLFFSFL